MSKKITALIPGAALALGIACIAKWLETLESSAGLHLIGASVIALFIGMAINAFFQPNKTTAPGIKFTSKKVLFSYICPIMPYIRFCKHLIH